MNLMRKRKRETNALNWIKSEINMASFRFNKVYFLKDSLQKETIPKSILGNRSKSFMGFMYESAIEIFIFYTRNRKLLTVRNKTKSRKSFQIIHGMDSYIKFMFFGFSKCTLKIIHLKSQSNE